MKFYSMNSIDVSMFEHTCNYKGPVNGANFMFDW